MDQAVCGPKRVGVSGLLFRARGGKESEAGSDRGWYHPQRGRVRRNGPVDGKGNSGGTQVMRYLALFAMCAAQAQDFSTVGHDAHRSGWVRSDPKINAASMRKP